MKISSRKTLKAPFCIVMLTIVYVTTGVLGNYLAVPPGYATVFWPPSGFALAAVYLCGYRVSIGVFLGAFIVNAINTADFFILDQFMQAVPSALIISAGATAQSCLGAYLIYKFVGYKTKLESLRSIFKFSFYGGPVSCLVGATIGTLTLIGVKSLPVSAAFATWSSWYVGDVLGVLVFSPILILLFSGRKISAKRKRYTVLPLLMIFTVVIGSFFYIKKSDKNKRVAEFSSDSELVKQEIDYKIRDHFKELESLRALYNSSNKVDQREFNTFARNIVDRGKAGGIAYAPLLNSENRNQFEQFLRDEKINFRLKKYNNEEHSQNCAPYCVALLFAYPENIHDKVSGLDLVGQAERAEAIRKSIESLQTRISAPVPLAGSNKLGFVSMLPVFKKGVSENTGNIQKIDGFVVNATNYEALFSEVLDKWLFKGIRLDVKDVESGNVIFSNSDTIITDEDFLLIYKTNIGGRDWEFCFNLSNQYILSNVNWTIWFALVASLLFMFLASVFLLAVTGQTAAIEVIVDRKTKELSDNNRFMKVIMDSVPDLIFVKNKNSEIIQGNAAFLQQFAPDKRDEIIGSVPYDHYPKHEAEVFKRHDKIAFDEGYSETNQTNTDYQGITRDYFTRKIRFETEDGTAYMLAIARDVTDEKQMLEDLEQSEQRFRASLENAPIGMSLVGMDQNWIVYNKALCETLGFDENEFTDQTLKSLTHPEDLKKDNDELKRLIKGEIDNYSVEKRYIKKEGGFVWILLTLALVRDENDKPLYFVAHTLDITERKQMDAELRRSNEELEQFAYVASHDLKAPLRHISLSAGFLAEQYKDKLDDNGLEMIDIMTQGTARMQDMIESLLEYSRVGQKSDHDMEEIAFSEIIKVAKEPLKPVIDETGAKVSLRGAKVVLTVHKVLIIQLFQNLIQNAIKYRKEEQAPRIKIEAKKGKSDITISISDNGIGIDEKHANKIFDVFQRLHGEGQYEGTGIGLAICKRIVEAHDGEIWLDTEYKDGCKLFIKLPIV